MIYLYSITGTREKGSGVVNHQNTYGFLDAANEDEALGKAIRRFKEKNPDHAVFLSSVMPTDLIAPEK